MATSLVRLRHVLNVRIPILNIYAKLTKQMHFIYRSEQEITIKQVTRFLFQRLR